MQKKKESAKKSDLEKDAKMMEFYLAKIKKAMKKKK